MMSTCVNGATSALSMGSSARYILLSGFIKFSIISAMITIVYLYVPTTITNNSIIYIHIHIITNLLSYFFIKLNMKIPKFLTTPKPNIWKLSNSIFLLR
jgi:hypothetical protein